MDDEQTPVGPELLHSFGARLCSDDIDVRDRDDLLFLAECVALDALDACLPPEKVAASIQGVLQRWSPEDIKQFSDANNGAWDFDEETEAAFRAIQERIVLTVNGGGTLARTVTTEEYLRLQQTGELEQQAPPKA